MQFNEKVFIYTLNIAYLGLPYLVISRISDKTTGRKTFLFSYMLTM